MFCTSSSRPRMHITSSRNILPVLFRTERNMTKYSKLFNMVFSSNNHKAAKANPFGTAIFNATIHQINDRIATQRYSSPEIPIGSRVMSRTTSAPSGRRSRKMVANVAGCRSFGTFRDCHTSIAFTPVGPQPNLAHIFGWIWD